MIAFLRGFGHMAAETMSPPLPTFDRHKLLRALSDVADSLNPSDPEAAATMARRLKTLWLKRALLGEDVSLAQIVGEGLPAQGHGAVVFGPIATHLVCPHHLTISLATVQLAYLPRHKVVGFGRLVALAKAATARLVLQENAACTIAEALSDQLDARAVVVKIVARHVCHALLEPASAKARATAWAQLGEEELCQKLVAIMAHGKS